MNARLPQRYCHWCHAANMRATRPLHSELPTPARLRANARSYASVYLKRGKLKKKPCERCGEEKVQMHHEDYSQPLQVRWLCRECHLALHASASKEPLTR